MQISQIFCTADNHIYKSRRVYVIQAEIPIFRLT